MRLELHCHSTCSDGSLSPTELATRAAQWGVELFCLTDHDTLAGYEESKVALTGLKPKRILRGLELSCKWEKRNIHLLVYQVLPQHDQDLRRCLELRLLERQERQLKIVDRLLSLGFEIDGAALLTRAEGRTPGRPDVAKALVEAGICSSIREAFDRFLRDGGPADVPMEGLQIQEALELCSAAGAKVSLAHPHTLKHPDLVRELLLSHRERGLTGLEAGYGRYTHKQRRSWTRMADELGVVVTGGSDFHGDAVPQVTHPGIDFDNTRTSVLLHWLECQ